MNCTHQACLSRELCIRGLTDSGVRPEFDPSGNYDPCTERCQFFADARLYMPQWEYRQLLRERQAQQATIVTAEIVKPRRKPKQEQIIEAARISEQQRLGAAGDNDD
jgi:hypothetical protein